MIKCAQCNYENVDGTQFCEGCGEELGQSSASQSGASANDMIKCPACDNLNPADNAVCEVCGTDLHAPSDGAAAAAGASTTSTPAAGVPAASVPASGAPASGAPASGAPAADTSPAGGLDDLAASAFGTSATAPASTPVPSAPAAGTMPPASQTAPSSGAPAASGAPDPAIPSASAMQGALGPDVTAPSATSLDDPFAPGPVSGSGGLAGGGQDTGAIVAGGQTVNTAMNDVAPIAPAVGTPAAFSQGTSPVADAGVTGMDAPDLGAAAMPATTATPTASTGTLEPGKVKMTVEQGMTIGAQFVLGDAEMLVGREDEEESIYPDLDLSDQDAGYVHRRHATLRFENGGLTVTHLGGTNKTRVNNRPLDDNVPTPVKIGDKIAFGKVVLRVQPV